MFRPNTYSSTSFLLWCLYYHALYASKAVKCLLKDFVTFSFCLKLSFFLNWLIVDVLALGALQFGRTRAVHHPAPARIGPYVVYCILFLCGYTAGLDVRVAFSRKSSPVVCHCILLYLHYCCYF